MGKVSYRRRRTDVYSVRRQRIRGQRRRRVPGGGRKRSGTRRCEAGICCAQGDRPANARRLLPNINAERVGRVQPPRVSRTARTHRHRSDEPEHSGNSAASRVESTTSTAGRRRWCSRSSTSPRTTLQSAQAIKSAGAYRITSLRAGFIVRTVVAYLDVLRSQAVLDSTSAEESGRQTPAGTGATALRRRPRRDHGCARRAAAYDNVVVRRIQAEPTRASFSKRCTR